MKKVMKYGVMIVVIVALGAAGYASYKAGKVVKTGLGSARRGSIMTFTEETGKLRLDRSRTVSALVGGRLSPVQVEEGDAVEAGQVLATIEDVRFREGIEQAKSSIRELEARIEGLATQVPKASELQSAELGVQRASKALEIESRSVTVLETELGQVRKERRRLKTLSEGGISPAADLERLETKETTLVQTLSNRKTAQAIATLGLESARLTVETLNARTGDVVHLRKVFGASIEGVRSRITILENDLEKTVLRAPFSGLILERFSKGEVFVPPGTPVVRIGDPASMQVEVDLLSDDLPDVAVGKSARVSGKSIGDLVLNGRVAKIHPEAFTKISSLGIEQQRVRVVIELERLDPALQPGLSVDVKIEARFAENALLVPEKSVFSREGESFVLGVRDGKLALLPVEEGLSDDEVVQILSGLEEGERIVLAPQNEMEEGMEVIPEERR